MQILETPVWKNYEKLNFYPSLQENISPDVFIVGGGLAGITTAYMLAGEGKKVAVLEKDKVGSGATEYTTAFLTQDIDTDLKDLVKMFGEDNARLVWESHARGIDLIEHLVQAENLDCEFKRCSAFVYTINKDGFKDLEEEFQAAQKLGFTYVKAYKDNFFNFQNYGLMETQNQAKFHPLKYLYQLSDATVRKGVAIYEDTEVTNIEQKDNLWQAKTSHGFTITAPDMVIATYYPFSNPKKTLLKKGMYVSYVFEVLLPKGLIPENIYWDDDNPYNYFRIDPYDAAYDRMIIGGQDHRAELNVEPEKNYKALEEYLKFLLPAVEYKINRKWTGPILEPSDGLALIGETYPGQFVATAFSGNGMTYSHLSALLLTDLIMGRQNAWASVYDPKRIPSLYQLMKKGKDYVGELFGGAAENVFKQVL